MVVAKTDSFGGYPHILGVGGTGDEQRGVTFAAWIKLPADVCSLRAIDLVVFKGTKKKKTTLIGESMTRRPTCCHTRRRHSQLNNNPPSRRVRACARRHRR